MSTAESFNLPWVVESEPAKQPPNASTDAVSKVRWDLIQLCVHVTRLLGVSRSIREIFGFVFSSPTPVTFEDIVAGLGMSNGSASYGLRYLRRIGAITVTYLARDRRDYYVAEVSLGRLVSGYLMENITYHLADNRERISSLRSTFGDREDLGSAHLSARLELLLEWNRQIGGAIAAANEALGSRAAERE